MAPASAAFFLTSSKGQSVLWAVLALGCISGALSSSNKPGASRKLLQGDPSVCPSELGFTGCFSPDGSSLNCILDSCSGSVIIAGSPANQPQAVRDSGVVLVNFFTAIGDKNFPLYKTAVEPYAQYFPDYQKSPNTYSNGQDVSVFNALRMKLQIPPGSDYHSIFKVTDASVSLSRGVPVGVGFTVNYPSVNPRLTFHFGLGVTSATPPGWQIIEFYSKPYGFR